MQKQYNASFSSKSFKSKSYITTEQKPQVIYSEYSTIITRLVNSRKTQNHVSNRFFKTHGAIIDNLRDN